MSKYLQLLMRVHLFISEGFSDLPQNRVSCSAPFRQSHRYIVNTGRIVVTKTRGSSTKFKFFYPAVLKYAVYSLDASSPLCFMQIGGGRYSKTPVPVAARSKA